MSGAPAAPMARVVLVACLLALAVRPGRAEVPPYVQAAAARIVAQWGVPEEPALEGVALTRLLPAIAEAAWAVWKEEGERRSLAFVEVMC